MQKKGQVTFFIILGLVIIFSLMFYFAMYQTSLANKPIQTVTDISGINTCSNDIFTETLLDLAVQGGYLELPENSIDTIFGQIPVYLQSKNVSIPNLDLIKKSLNKELSISFKDCASKNMKNLEQEIIVDVSLNQDDVTANINYPYLIVDGDKERVIPLIQSKEKLRVLHLFNIVQLVVNEIKEEPMIVPASFLIELEEKYSVDIESYWDNDLILYFITDINQGFDELTWMFAVKK